MLIGVIEPKQPGETYIIEIDFSNDLDPTGSEVITSRQATSVRLLDGVDSTNAFLSGAPSGTNSTCTARIVAGASGERHRVQMRVATNLGNVFEHEVDVQVTET